MATSQEINLTMERYNSDARAAERKFDCSSSITVVKPNCDDEMLKDKMLDVDLRNAIKVPHRNLSQTEQQIKSKGQCVEKSDTQLIADDKLEKNANESLNLPDISLPDTDQYPGSIYKPRRIERGDEKNEQVLTSSRQYQEQAAPNNEENECIEQNLGGLKTALRQPETSMSEEYTNSDSDEKHLDQSFGGYTDYHYIVGKHEQTRIDNDTEKYSDYLDTEKYEIIIPSIIPLQNEGLVCDENKPCKEKTAKTINEANRNNTQSEVNECGARSVYEDKEHDKGMKEENVRGTGHENKVKQSKISTDEDKKMKGIVDSIVRNVVVAWKFKRNMSYNFSLQTVFVITLFFQTLNPEIFNMENARNQTFQSVREHVVYPVTFGNEMILLPEPNLPRTLNNEDLGINWRPAFADTLLSGEVSDRVSNGDGLISNVENMQQLHSNRRNSNTGLPVSSTEFISVSNSQLTETVRRVASTDLQVASHARIDHVPVLPSSTRCANV